MPFRGVCNSMIKARFMVKRCVRQILLRFKDLVKVHVYYFTEVVKIAALKFFFIFYVHMHGDTLETKRKQDLWGFFKLKCILLF